MITVLMVQLLPAVWQITSKTGNVIQTNIVAGNSHEAEQYVRRYVSGFQGWAYEMRPLTSK